jgi:hypothetical protein
MGCRPSFATDGRSASIVDLVRAMQLVSLPLSTRERGKSRERINEYDFIRDKWKVSGSCQEAACRRPRSAAARAGSMAGGVQRPGHPDGGRCLLYVRGLGWRSSRVPARREAGHRRAGAAWCGRCSRCHLTGGVARQAGGTRDGSGAGRAGVCDDRSAARSRCPNAPRVGAPRVGVPRVGAPRVGAPRAAGRVTTRCSHIDGVTVRRGAAAGGSAYLGDSSSSSPAAPANAGLGSGTWDPPCSCRSPDELGHGGDPASRHGGSRIGFTVPDARSAPVPPIPRSFSAHRHVAADDARPAAANSRDSAVGADDCRSGSRAAGAGPVIPRSGAAHSQVRGARTGG